MKIVHDLNYQPDILARTLASKRNYHFAVLMPYTDKDSGFWKSPRIGLQKAYSEIEHFGVQVIEYLFNQFDRKSFRKQAERIISDKPDALLIAPVYYEETIDLVSNCQSMSIPYVFINSNIEKYNEISFVGQNSFQSGFVGAKLMCYGLEQNSNLIIINISRALNNHKHIMSRQSGFREYISQNQKHKLKLDIFDIEDVDDEKVWIRLNEIFADPGNIHGVFVTNSKVYKIARYLSEKNISHIRLIGYDLLELNLQYLENEVIHFLISQKPFEQGYNGVMALFNNVILNKEIKKEYYLPIDIITKENYKYYIDY